MEQYIAVMTRKTVNTLFIHVVCVEKSKMCKSGSCGWSGWIIIHKGAFCFQENDLLMVSITHWLWWLCNDSRQGGLFLWAAGIATITGSVYRTRGKNGCTWTCIFCFLKCLQNCFCVCVCVRERERERGVSQCKWQNYFLREGFSLLSPQNKI